MISYDIEEIVPHSGAMSLLSTLKAYSVDDMWLEAQATIRDNNPFLTNGIVPSWVGIEYMAQAIAALSGIISRQRGETLCPAFYSELVTTNAHHRVFKTLAY